MQKMLLEVATAMEDKGHRSYSTLSVEVRVNLMFKVAEQDYHDCWNSDTTFGS